MAEIKDEKAWEYVQAQARDEGRMEERIETARKMLAKGFGLIDITELTGLSADELAKL